MFKDTTRAESVYTSAVRGGLQALVRNKRVEKKKVKGFVIKRGFFL
jgi:hypothetical protein